ncbi:MAG: TMEM165/GDT1 family protein, partial [Ilumatobacteraceae bacterium]|nr:TMEM165/GDT1 family protein [Ilumatobacteraceae bacterium]
MAVRHHRLELGVMWSAFFLSFGIIFVAELGDKSQLMAMAFAARYKALPVLLGISIATAVTHALSVGLGSVVGDRMPTA